MASVPKTTTPRVVVLPSERNKIPEKSGPIRKGMATSQEKNRLSGQGFKKGTAAYNAELLAQRLREASGLSPVPKAFHYTSSPPATRNISGFEALGAFPGYSELVSGLTKILSLQRNTKLIKN